MNDKFAIDPDIFSTYQAAREICGKFGLNESRFISAFPRAWYQVACSMIDQWADGLTKKAAKRSLELMKERGGVVRSGLPYDPDKAWVPNAITNMAGFHRILLASPHPELMNHENIQSYDAFEDKFFSTPREDKVKATAEEYGRIARELLECSSELVLVDPYLFNRAPNFKGKNNIDVMKEFMRIGLGRSCYSYIAYTSPEYVHVNLENVFRDLLENVAPKRLITIRVRCLFGDDEDSTHPRYLFSTKGGLRFDKGFEPSGKREDVAALDIQMHKILCKKYLDCGPQANENVNTYNG